jgi:hypothetical protein
MFILPCNIILPETYKFPPIPTPPATINAPVPKLLAIVVLDIVKFPIITKFVK